MDPSLSIVQRIKVLTKNKTLCNLDRSLKKIEAAIRYNPKHTQDENVSFHLLTLPKNIHKQLRPNKKTSCYLPLAAALGTQPPKGLASLVNHFGGKKN